MEVLLGKNHSIEDLVNVARNNYNVNFSDEYLERVKKANTILKKWVKNEKVIYGVTTGFGAMSNVVISNKEAEQLQKNIILSHSVSVGEPMEIEEVRATMFMILQNIGQGFCGARIEVVEKYRELLNMGITPYVPKEGSVGYLAPEAHIAAFFMGYGKGFYKNEILSAEKILDISGVKKLELSFKEGLIIVSGTTSVTALGSLSLFDMIQASKVADIIASITIEVLRGTTRAFDLRLMSVRAHEHQIATAKNLLKILDTSKIAKNNYNYRLQDALSLRCIPQAHGASKKIFYDALKTIELEINSCCDNPIIWNNEFEEDVISGCNADSGYVGIAMDTCAIASTYIAKMSERRNNRLVNGNLSELPWFLIKKPGLNSGLMIPQYTQAGLLNDMKILSTPSTIDNIPTCGDQEDYVAMGYNSSKKARKISKNLEYILAIELLSAYQAHGFIDNFNDMCSDATKVVFELIESKVNIIENDVYLYPYIDHLYDLIHSGKLLNAVTEKIGKLS